jgi:hypothetical protein
VQHLVQDIKNSVYGEKTPLFGLFLDVKKVFDSVHLEENN